MTLRGKKILAFMTPLMLAVFFVVGFLGFEKSSKNEKTEEVKVAGEKTEVIISDGPAGKFSTDGEAVEYLKHLPRPSMEKIKTKGCVTDGFLSGKGGDIESTIAMINRSECEYLHRAVETWLEPPDFEEVREIKSKITKKNIVYGMFIAEAIDKKADYRYPAEERKFDFSEMCREGSDNFWGEHTCKPSFQREEYRKYLRHITRQAIDEGVQVFMFGQVFYQDSTTKPLAGEIVKEMKEYAASRGTEVLVGAQTNSITDPKYLKLFDFIEGGVGLRTDGRIEDGPCFSRWWDGNSGWCWALLWHDNYVKNANNVLIHLDWSGRFNDDMSTFARMEKSERTAVLKKMHSYFISQGSGFLMPMLAVLPKQNGGGCKGSKDGYYSADKKYTCGDEDEINKIMRANAGKLKERK